MGEYWKTEEQYQVWLDDPDTEEIRDLHFSELHEISLTEVCEVPYWIEEYAKLDNYRVQYIPGYWEPKRVGDIIEIDGIEYRYIDSQPLPEEIEHQAEDGSLLYEYRGHSFLRILELVE